MMADFDPEARKNAEMVYDQILDILMVAIKENFGKDEINNALDIVSLAEATIDETHFERAVREKQELEIRLKESLKERAEE